MPLVKLNFNIILLFPKSYTRYRPTLHLFSNLHTETKDNVSIAGKEYVPDHITNVTPKILSLVGRNLHLQKCHPLGHLRNRIVQFIYSRYKNKRGHPIFSVYDHFTPVVTPHQNFDTLLVPSDHVSRQRRDNYYINKNYLLRAHTTAHQSELIQMGLNSFLVIGDVYRRDEIDSSHYPVFHQLDAVRLFNKQDIFSDVNDLTKVSLFEERPTTETYQGCHADTTVKYLTKDLQMCLQALASSVFGKDVQWRWVDAYFPFTHPSWELEVNLNNKWTELLGCGIIRQEILKNSGAGSKVGWAFGLGLERWAMKLYEIPDIRLFWSTDPRFAAQFNFADPKTSVKFQVHFGVSVNCVSISFGLPQIEPPSEELLSTTCKPDLLDPTRFHAGELPFSNQPPCINDLSFWLPINGEFEKEDFYDLVRSVGEDLIEKVELVDDFTHPKVKMRSQCYRITYRSWHKSLEQSEVTRIHQKIAEEAESSFRVQIR